MRTFGQMQGTEPLEWGVSLCVSGEPQRPLDG